MYIMNSNYSFNVDKVVIWILLIILPISLFFISFLLGRYPVAPIDVIKTILSPIFPSLKVSPAISSIVFNIRLPRIIASLAVGASLAIAGSTFQGIFRNPLVSPDLLGVSQGAGFGAALAILINMGNAIIQIFAFIFGIISVLITYTISKTYRSEGILVLVLAGTAVSAFFSALISGTKFIADPYDKLPQITFWLMGSLSSITFEQLAMIAIPIIIGLIIILVLRWHLNILTMGDEEARSLGLNPDRIRIIAISACTLITSAAVSISGVIGWVGLVVPHICRMIVGPDHKILIPASLSLGASFLLLIDTISRTMVSIEIPLGILTAVIGVPIFLYLLRKGYSQW